MNLYPYGVESNPMLRFSGMYYTLLIACAAGGRGGWPNGAAYERTKQRSLADPERRYYLQLIGAKRRVDNPVALSCLSGLRKEFAKVLTS